MAKLGNTTLLSGQSYGNFTVGGTLTTQTIVAPNPKTTNTSSNGIAFCSDGTLCDIEDKLQTFLGAKGNSYTPIYSTTSGLQQCNLFTGGSSTGLLAVTGSGGGVTLPLTMNFSTTANKLGQLKVTYSTDYWNASFEASNMQFRVQANGGFFQTSDKRKKTNFRDLDLNKCYEMIEKCQTVLFDWKDGSGKDQMGVIAQEVEEFFPEIVSTDENGYKSVDYAKLAVVCMRVLKDLIDKVNG